jgi:Macrocin-O-methyltransferase (TylF)
MPETPDWAAILGKTLFGGVQHPHHRFDVERCANIIASFSSAEFMLRNFPKALNCFHFRALLAEAAKNSNINGLVLEFGVHNGNTITMIANTFPQPVCGFDSFQGLPEHWTGTHRTGRFSTEGKPPPNLPDNVSLEIGLFQDTIDGFLDRNPEPIKFMHVDSDLYSSAKFVLEATASRIVPGTVILFNDFFNYPGWEDGEAKAWRIFTEQYKVEFEYIGWASRESGVAVLINKIGRRP